MVNGYVLDWPRMVSEFLYWSQQGWGTNALINLNPLAGGLTVTRPGAVVDSIVTETDAPDIPPAWLREEGIAFNEPAFVERIARELAVIRGVDDSEFASAVWGNAMQALPRWSVLCASIPNLHLAS